MRTLEGQTVLLTGATRGIGRALALRLANSGTRLALCGRDRDALRDVAGTIEDRGAGKPLTQAFDLADEQALGDFYREVKERLGALDILINNAGFNPRKAPLHDVTSDEFDAVMAVNLKAPWLFMRHVFPDMKARAEGHIVNVLSTVCHHDMETMGAYTAAKQALRAVTAIFRKEARPHGIRVTAVYPGGTNTEFRPSERPDYMRPESVAEAIYVLLILPEDLVPHEFTFRPMVECNF